MPRLRSSMKILLPEGSSMSARDIVYALGSQHQIDVLDPSLFCQLRYSSLVHRCYRCPSYWREPQAYLDFLIERLDRESYDVLLPTHEQVYLLSRFRKQIGARVGLAVPDFETINRLQSKAEFTRLLDEIDLPGPPTRIVQTRADLLAHDQFPCFVKVDYSTAGNGVERVDAADELAALADRLEQGGVWEDRAEVLLQQAASGMQCTALAIFDSGRMVGELEYEIRRPGIGGWGMNGESLSHPQVAQHIAKLGAHLKYHGALFFDYFHDHVTDEVVYIEANPRFGTALFPKLCGLDFGELFLQLSTGEPIDTPDGGLPRAKVGVRFHQNFLMLISAAKGGASRRQLLSQLVNAYRRSGFFSNSEDTITRPHEDRLSVIPAIVVSMLLVAFPSAAHWLVRRTLANYTLPAEGARAIRDLPIADDHESKLDHTSLESHA